MEYVLLKSSQSSSSSFSNASKTFGNLLLKIPNTVGKENDVYLSRALAIDNPVVPEQGITGVEVAQPKI